MCGCVASRLETEAGLATITSRHSTGHKIFISGITMSRRVVNLKDNPTIHI